ncbi:MAG TPA: fumarate/nitrate reduction transcriptional regulator Fnr [Casimicrobiaceae bacterium]|nr:fumarate/nitrate reduction transcriptional regulator Fnr [Casimicrobiaceae bacterium]
MIRVLPNDRARAIDEGEGSEAIAIPKVVLFRGLKAHCVSCNVRELCLPFGLDSDGLRALDDLISNRLRVHKGDVLYRPGDAFVALYAIRVGSFKTTVLAEDGREQVSGYHMLGDIVGLEGIGQGHHVCQAVALEDSDVCVLPFDRLEQLAHAVPQLQRNLYGALTKEIANEHGLLLLLGSMRAEERLAVFLVNLSNRYRARGYSSTEFVLRMTREEIGSYLGLKLETISRLFSKFQENGLIQVQGRAVKLIDFPALRHMIGEHG